MNPRDLGLILAQGLVVYLLFSTLIIDASIVGSFGHKIGVLSREIFGLIAYPMYAVAVYILYRIYRTHTLNVRSAEVVIATLLLFFTLLIVQALILPHGLDGSFGRSFIAFMSPFIGLFGVWVFWAATTLIAVVIMRDMSLVELAQMLKLQAPKRKKAAQMSEENSSRAFDEKEPLKAQASELLEEDVVQEVSYSISLEDKLNSILPEDEEAQFEIKRLSDSKEENEPHMSFEEEVILTNPQEEFEMLIEEEILPPETEVIQKSVEQTEVVPPLQVSEVLDEEDTPHHAVIVDELEENKKLLDDIEKGKVEKPRGFVLPKLDFLKKPDKQHKLDEDHLDQKIRNLIDKLNKFKIEGDVVRTYTGPVVSTFEFKPAAHIKVSKILNLQDDLAMALKAKTIRIQAPIPGKDVVGIEIPNEEVHTIYLREILESEIFQNASSPLTIVLGQDIVGKPFVTDLKKLPHLLIAGTTGSGKSVGINGMILSLLYRNSPEQLKFVMIDPKMLEFSIYNDIPHLLTPVITKPKQAITALNNMVSEMERRYALMSESRTKNIDNYNEKMAEQGREKLPYIVVIIDELADLMMTSGKEVEHSIGRLAQMARASGIHLIVATQRPSVDVVTGLIKANLPSRISYKVGQKVDSKVILDAMGAEALVGRGDMLFTPPGTSGLVRLHAPWSDESEIEEIVEFIKSQKEVEYDQRFLAASNGDENADITLSEDLDPLYEEAKEIVISEQKTSISYLQRRLQIGYNKAARIVEQLEAMGVLSEPNGKGVREIL